jgi:hypothetical protein
MMVAYVLCMTMYVSKGNYQEWQGVHHSETHTRTQFANVFI